MKGGGLSVHPRTQQAGPKIPSPLNARKWPLIMSSLLYSLVCEKYDLILLSLQQLAEQHCFRYADKSILDAFSHSQSKSCSSEEASLTAFLEQKVMLAG